MNMNSRARTLLAEFDRTLTTESTRIRAGSTVVLLVRNGDIEWAGRYGWIDNTSTRAPGLDTPYRVASITKTFTATLLLQLAEEGVLSLQSRIDEIVPEALSIRGYDTAANGISLQELATHTSGLPEEPDSPNFARGPNTLWQEKTSEALASTSVDLKRRGAFHYSNIGYAVLGLALCRATGKDFPDLLRSRILSPLQMSASGTVVEGDLPGQVVSGCHIHPDGTVDWESPAVEHRGRGYKLPSGGVCSSASDLARFLGAICDGSPGFLIPQIQRDMLATHVFVPGNDRYDGYGLGIQISERDQTHRVVGHGGDFAGYISGMYLIPEKGLGIVLLRSFSVPETDIRRRTIALLRTVADL